MNRREPISKGYVNFPINDPSYEDTKEGGMVVKLYVINDKWDDPDNFNVCCGSNVCDVLSESIHYRYVWTPKNVLYHWLCVCHQF